MKKTENIIKEAAALYLSRKDRAKHPIGKFDRAGRWDPADSERCSCCDGIRIPSRAYPYSLMTHCRSLQHICHLLDVDPTDVRKELKKLK
jgi:hypothetical protein